MKRKTELEKREKKEQKIKKRNWWFVIYPDSLPNNWKDILNLSGLPYAISPLHCDDLNPDGTPKKPHYHVIVLYQNPTTFRNVCTLTESLNAPHPQYLDSIKGAYRYLTHKDNPEKAQYDEKNIELGNGFNYRDIIEITKSEALKIKRELTLIIKEREFIEYYSFILYCIEEKNDDYFEVASTNTIYFQAFISSLRNSKKEEKYAKMLKEIK